MRNYINSVLSNMEYIDLHLGGKDFMYNIQNNINN